MIQAIFYKEWLKTRWYLLPATLFIMGISGYAMLRIHRGISIQGADHLWTAMVLKNAIFVDLLQFIPLLAGLLMAIVQFAPEMHRKSLKLTLHLPYSQLSITATMLAYGLLTLTAVYTLPLLGMCAFLSQHFPVQLVRHIMLSTAPWWLAGLSGYLLASWVTLEPTWKRRVANMAIAALVLRIYFLAPGPEAYNAFLPWLAVYTLLSASLTWISVTRFKAGRQD